MKNHENIIIVLLTVLIVTFSFSGCEPDDVIEDVISECDAPENQMDTEIRQFRVSCYVTYEDGLAAYDQFIVIAMYEHSCEGYISEIHEYTGMTDAFGWYTLNDTNSFNYNNKKDVVEIRVSTESEEKTFTYPWHHVDDWGADVHNVTCEITIPNGSGEAPLADFTANETSVIAGQSIDFSDESSNNPSSWLWDFGDGNTSSTQNPSHTYSDPGSFTISLTATNISGSHTETKENYIVVEEEIACEAFTYQGQTYNAVLIGSQCWMKENLNYTTGTSRCYDDEPSNCDTYGRLYHWETIMNGEASSNTVPSGVQGICPNGWHIPSDDEWKVLRDYVGGEVIGGEKIKAESGWDDNGNGTDESGFSALPSGHINFSSEVFYNIGMKANWWTATVVNEGFAIAYGVKSTNLGFPRSNPATYIGFSVRCVKD